MLDTEVKPDIIAAVSVVNFRHWLTNDRQQIHAINLITPLPKYFWLENLSSSNKMKTVWEVFIWFEKKRKDCY